MKMQRILIRQYVGTSSLDDVCHCALLALLILLIIDIINTCHPLTVWHPAHSSAVFSSSCGCGCFVIYWRHVDVISVDVLHGLVRQQCAAILRIPRRASWRHTPRTRTRHTNTTDTVSSWAESDGNSNWRTEVQSNTNLVDDLVQRNPSDSPDETRRIGNRCREEVEKGANWSLFFSFYKIYIIRYNMP